MNDWVWLCSSKTLFMALKFEFHLTYKCHKTLFFQKKSNCLKMWKTFFVSGLCKEVVAEVSLWWQFADLSPRGKVAGKGVSVLAAAFSKSSTLLWQLAVLLWPLNIHTRPFSPTVRPVPSQEMWHKISSRLSFQPKGNNF